MTTKTLDWTNTASWETLFKKHGVIFDPKYVLKYPRNDDAFMPLVIPASLHINDVLELFKTSLKVFGIGTFIAPRTTWDPGKFDTTQQTYQLSDLVSKHVRITDSGTYSYFVRPHVSEDSGELIRAGKFDHRMTIVEAFWYHIYMLDVHGKAYLDLQENDNQTCRSSTYSDRPGSPSLYWDLQDFKVTMER